MLVLEQSKNERLLYEYMQGRGKDVLWQTELVSFTQTDTNVTALVKTANESYAIEANYLVGCDGPKSPVRHGLGLVFEGSTFERVFYVADVQIDWPFSHDALHVCLARNSGMAFFPMPGEKRYRIVGAFPEGFDKEEGETLYEEIEQYIKQESGINLEISHVNWFSTYKVHTRHVEKFSVNRCFLAGDSAHVHTPAGGQGMNTGIQDAYNLAWKLAFVLHNKADTTILESYNQERLKNAKHLTQSTDRMFNLVSSSGWLVKFIRTIVMPAAAKYIINLKAVRNRFFPFISQIGINYRESMLSEHDGDQTFKIKAGDRMPYYLIDGASVYDKLHEAKFHLLVFTNNAQTIKEKIGSQFEHILDYQILSLSEDVIKIFGTDKAFIILLRPDNHIGFISTEVSYDKIATYLKQNIGIRV
ncbi:MAG TPA: FAD-dependent monooxygenase, partial [Methylotenera sp.]|nr:FAD-dependent monooxygenase [Methylotenera sp.]